MFESSAFAQNGPNEPNELAAPLTNTQLESAQRMKNVGMALAIVGAVGVNVSIPVMAFSPRYELAEGANLSTFEAYGQLIIGSISLAISAGILAAGIPLWVVGGKRGARLSNALARIPLPFMALSPDNSTYSFGITWRG